ncbi:MULTISPECIES: cache domain-containing sensor histidine kinase [Paenibacillus]|uniref:Histidine kinase n=2 Tax=Paenibacillus TaxID=44249 RepID=A0ABX2Z601_PAEPO|nr:MULTISPECIES: sensor histidine kinase [Paenibacillus]AIW41089.1 histidine kinase [Paenibacillus polymyxa CR1]ALA43355.1 histidine kinase [Paenibacillus peoriae]APB74853.1 sensor histidine kinase [Paenibacillus polymyxa]MDR6777185.1 two-component system sensor histidine kinase YesM [Paenibacillus peoriae]ODA06311.1 histidine kinase [Paenibacillus polymyxa]
MRSRSRFQPLNTLRNQIFIGFILVMLIMMSVAGAFIYLNVSHLLKDSAERHIGQTAVQASGRLDALIGQMDSLTEQVANHPSVQHILLEERNGGKVNFGQRQSLLQVMHSYQAYMPSVGSLELYTAEGKMLFPIREGSLEERIGQADIREANQMKGRLVWIGIDPEDSRSLLAIRQVSLVDRWFSRGGYLITRMERSYFGLNGATAVNEEADETMLLVDRQGQLLSGEPMNQTDLSGVLHSKTQTVHIGEREYVKAVQQSERTGWSLLILIPVSVVTDGITVLRTTLIISASLGAVLFLFMSFMLSTLITRPIGHLIQAMRRSREGALALNPEPAAAVELRELNAEYNTMIVDINELIRVICEKEVLQSQTELKALQAQINPHFLFNTLDAFNWSLQEKGEEELAGLMVSMSRLFRYVIEPAHHDSWVTLGEEMAQIRRYLELMEMRLGERLSWQIHMPSEAARIPLPKLLIQPILENAILHGVENRIGNGRVEISVTPSTRSGWTKIAVIDNGPGMTLEELAAVRTALMGGAACQSKGIGMGLVNVQRRLALYYDSASYSTDGVLIHSAEQEGTVVAFEIPDEYGGR